MYKGGTYSHVPAYSMGPKAKPDAGSPNPGPGTYDLASGFGWKSSSKYSFGKGNKLGRDQNVPGPGSYDVNNGLDPKKTALDRDSRFSPYNSHVPGPGTYDSNPNSRVGYSFGKMKRVTPVKPAGPDYKIPHSIPDVASYNYPSMDRRKIHI